VIKNEKFFTHNYGKKSGDYYGFFLDFEVLVSSIGEVKILTVRKVRGREINGHLSSLSTGLG